MTTNSSCIVCWSDLLLDGRESYSITMRRTTASNVCLMFKLFDLLGEEFFHGNLCQTCFELVEQIDCFEQNIMGSKEQLRDRYRQHDLDHRKDADEEEEEGEEEEGEEEGEDEEGGGGGRGRRRVQENIYRNKEENRSSRKRRNNKSFKNDIVLDGLDDLIGNASCLIEIKQERNDDDDDDDDDDEEDVEGNVNVAHHDDVILNNHVSDGPHRITPLQYDLFKLRCPKFTLPKIDANEYDELTCVFCQQKKSAWMQKIHHYLLAHKDQAPYLCPVDNEPLKPETMAAHAVKYHGFVLDSRQIWTANSFYAPGQLPAGDVDGKIVLKVTENPDDDKRCQCASCGLICTSEMAYLFHRKFHHGITQPLTQCPFCETCTTDFRELRIHVVGYHFGIKKFSLPDMNKKQTQQQQLQQQQQQQQHVSSGNGVRKKGDELNECLLYPEKCLTKKNNEDYTENPKIPSEQLDRMLEEYMESLAQVPREINNDVEGEAWDIFKLKRPNLEINSVPGEKKCFACDTEFDHYLMKIRHRCQSHIADGISAYHCHICLQTFSFETNGSKHMIKDHAPTTGSNWLLGPPDHEGKVPLSNGQFQCGSCSLTCGTLLAYWFHHHNTHSEKVFDDLNCNFCRTKCSNLTQLRRHILTTHGHYRFQCPSCHKSWQNAEDFKDHVKRSHIKPSPRVPGYEKKDMLACQLCHHDVRGPRMLAKHMQTVHGMKQEVDCAKCGTRFDSYSSLTTHMRTAHTKSAPCQFCGKLFESRQTLEYHIATIHEGKEISKEFMCENCSRTFANKQLLQTHMRCHSDDKKITCKICGKAFKWESSLVSHTRAAHSNMTLTAQFDCKYCGKSFKDKSNLKNHIYTHTGEKPFHCETCGKGFIRRDLMKSHTASCQR